MCFICGFMTLKLINSQVCTEEISSSLLRGSLNESLNPVEIQPAYGQIA